MKKIILFLSIIFIALSCSDDDMNAIDYTEFDAVLAEAKATADESREGVNDGDIIIGSTEILLAVIEQYEPYRETAQNQGTLDNATEALRNAIDVYNSSIVSVDDRDITELTETISNAQTLVDEAEIGSAIGEYPAEAVTALEDAIEVAQGVADDETTPQSVIDDATAALNDAIDAFENSVNGVFVLNLDGSSYIETPTFQGIGGDGARTMEVWIKTDASTTDSTLIMAWGVNESQAKWDMRLNFGRLRIEYAGGALESVNTVNDGAWHHLAIVVPFDGASLSDVLFYIDGVSEPTDPGGNPSTPINTSLASNFLIGHSPSHEQRFFLGEISDVRIWNVARSENDINSNKDIRLDGDEEGLAGYWKFNDGMEETTAADSSPSNHTGEFVGSPSWSKTTSGLPFINE